MGLLESYRRKKLKKLAAKVEDRKGYIKKAKDVILADDYKHPTYLPVKSQAGNIKPDPNMTYKQDYNNPDITDLVKMTRGTYAFKGLTHLEAEKKKLEKKLKK